MDGNECLGAAYKNPVTMTKGLNFGQALEALKSGQRVCREGWNGKNMWIAYTPGSQFPGESAKKGHAAALLAKERPGELITLGAHIDMKAADGTLVVGWLASQTDMLAEDWCILE